MFGRVIFDQVRYASKKAAGTCRNGRKTAGKRLGLKATPGEPVVCGHVLVRQRGFKFYPGIGVTSGRDHTLTAVSDGKMQIHFDLSTQRRIVYVDDGTQHPPMSESKAKQLIASHVDPEKYLKLSHEGRYHYVMQIVAQLAEQQKNEIKQFQKEKAMHGVNQRRFELVDLTLL